VAQAWPGLGSATDSDGSKNPDRLTIAPCGAARQRHAPPLLFRGGRLEAARFEHRED
jgi:hypothetical protein